MKYLVYLLAVIAGYFWLSPSMAHAATIIVTNSGLQETNTSGNYVNDGDCTLREAIKAANTDLAVDTCSAGSGADTISLPAGIYDIINIDNGATGIPVISSHITITGAGQDTTIIRRSNDDRTADRLTTTPLFRLLQVSSTGNLTLNQLTLRGGLVDGSNYGGAILNNNLLTVNNSAIVGNSYTNTVFNHGGGGGIHTVLATAITTINDSKIHSNSSVYFGAGIYCQRGTLTISNSEIFNNMGSGIGLGVWSSSTGCQASITGSKMYGNTATTSPNFWPGAAIAGDNYGSGSGANNSLLISNTEIYSNTGKAAVYCHVQTCAITNSSIHDNSGAGVYLYNTSKVTQTSIYNNGNLGLRLTNSYSPATEGPVLNDSNDADVGTLNFPVIIRSEIVGNILEVEGFARPGVAVEIFKSDNDSSGFGEGEVLLTSKTEGSADDLDSTTGNYGPDAVNGTVVGTDSTNRFKFRLLLSSIPPLVVGNKITSTATLSNATSEFGNNAPVSGLATSIIPSLTLNCIKAPVGRTTTCTTTLPAGSTLPADVKMSIGTAIPAGSCSASGNSVTCANVPTSLTRELGAINLKIGDDTLTNTGEKALVTGPLIQGDIPTLASTAVVTCTPDPVSENGTVTCSGTLPELITGPVQPLSLQVEGGKAVTCTVTGQTFVCGNISLAALGASTTRASFASNLLAYLVPKAHAASMKNIQASVGGATFQNIGLSISLDVAAPRLAKTGNNSAPLLGSGLILLASAFYIRRKMA